MALITCPDCQSPVSDLADNCIHCGRPLRPPPLPPSAKPPWVTRRQLLVGVGSAVLASAGAWGLTWLLDELGPRNAPVRTTDARVSVRCVPVPKYIAEPPTMLPVGEVTCSVVHESGADAAKACWGMRITCANGTDVRGDACTVIGPGETQSVGLGGLQNAPACDTVSSAKLERVLVSQP